MIVKEYVNALKTEFSSYNGKRLGKDVLAGITVAAVALPLALAFGVSSGADAAAGLITAILAGLFIGALSGGSYQISGPTGAMTAILVPLVAQYKMQGVFIACFISGIILLLCGVLRLGTLVSFIPAPVITGFTSGIAVIIALGQVTNLTGLTTSGETTVEKLAGYFTVPQSPDITAIVIGLAVIVFMAVYPKKLNQYFPGSLFAIILATAANMIFHFDVAVVGEIPRTLPLENRLVFSQIDLATLKNLLAPAASIAALGLIESLLCGASAGRMKNEKLNADRELVAQGIGNMLIPFFGGVPATAAIARTSVAIKSGGQTRLTSIIHSAVLLLSMFLLAPVMSAIPLSALSGVLIMTAWRMNEWSAIKSIFKKRLKTAMAQFLITMAATVVFDLTIAIMIGIVFSVVLFVVKVSEMQVSVSDIDGKKLADDVCGCEQFNNAAVAYITGPLYFGTVGKLEEKLHELSKKEIVIISMRGVPFADMSGVQGLSELCERLSLSDISIYFSSVQPSVLQMFDRCGLTQDIGHERFFWSTDKVLAHIAQQ